MGACVPGRARVSARAGCFAGRAGVLDVGRSVRPSARTRHVVAAMPAPVRAGVSGACVAGRPGTRVTTAVVATVTTVAPPVAPPVAAPVATVTTVAPPVAAPAAATRRRRRGRRRCRNVALLRRPVVVAVRRGGVQVHDDRHVFVQVVAGLRIARGVPRRARARTWNGARASATFVPRFPALSRQWRVPSAVRLVVHHLQALPVRVQGRQRERHCSGECSQWRRPSGSGGGGGGYDAWGAVVALPVPTTASASRLRSASGIAGVSSARASKAGGRHVRGRRLPGAGPQASRSTAWRRR